MYWTVMPETLLTHDVTPTRPKEFYYKNRKLLCCPMENNTYCVVRIISSNPQDYLDRRFQPGTIISGATRDFSEIF